MKVLVVGGGGREHALTWKIRQSPKVRKVYCAPGNAGIAKTASCIPIKGEDIDGLLQFALREKIDLTVVGPEAALAEGIVNRFELQGLRIFGPTQQAAELESSKSFAKNLMLRHGIPTARGRTFTRFAEAKAYIRRTGAPLVVKADGLAAGKGVIVCDAVEKAQEALEQIMRQKIFGEAGRGVVIEACLNGEEASFLAFTDGRTVLPLPSSQDHKAVYDGDKGPNTGGMGAYSPAPIVDTHMHRIIMQQIMEPAVAAMAAEGRPYKGVLYAGVMISGDQVKVLEFNCRFGDPEAQPLMMRLQSDIVPLMEAVIDERLAGCRLEIDPRAAVCVVMAAGGYPGAYSKDLPISGLQPADRMRDVVVFHAGTAAKEGKILTRGGRVLGVTALGDTIDTAIARSYQAVSKISWEKVYYRKDIGWKALARTAQKPRVIILMGSDSDLPIMSEAVGVLKKFDIPFEITVASAHRSPDRAVKLAAEARDRGIQVIIAGAGHAAHLAGVLAAHTILPVIGVPIDSSCLQGLDSLLSTVQMPPGIPVATMAVGKSGARNAAILAARILALADADLAVKLEAFKAEMEQQVAAKAQKLNAC